MVTPVVEGKQDRMDHTRGGSEAGKKIANGLFVVILRVAGSSRTAEPVHPVRRATRPEEQPDVARIGIAETTIIMKMDPQVRYGLL